MSIINTENSYIKYYYNNDPSKIWREEGDDTSHMSVGGCTRPPMSFRDECIRTARALTNNYKNLTIFMSLFLKNEYLVSYICRIKI